MHRGLVYECAQVRLHTKDRHRSTIGTIPTNTASILAQQPPIPPDFFPSPNKPLQTENFVEDAIAQT